ncbi:MAG: FAD-dependent oxidoreductase [Candidatus Bathyarchaeota archaeon]
MTAVTCTFKNKRKLPPCRAACPADVNVQGYVALLQQGRFKEAVELVRKSIPFPAVCGRVCYCPCEDACSRKNIDQPVSIRALKWLIADIEREQGRVKPEPVAKTHSEKVAIIGAGPAGLSAAYELAKLGYPVTVFDAMSEPGGTMRYFIPDSRLRKDVVANEIAYIHDVGVEIRMGLIFGEDLTIDSLRDDGYEAMFLAMGVQKVWSRKLKRQNALPLPSILLKVESGEALTELSTISVDPLTLETRIPGVFAGGDVVTGKASGIVYAIGAGKRAAISIHRYLNRQDLRTGRKEEIDEITWVKDWERIAKKPRRHTSPRADVAKQRVSFEEAEEHLAKIKEAAIFEARRCLECGPCSECLGSEGLCEADKAVVDEALCIGCNVCVTICPFDAVNKNEKGVAKVRVNLCKGCGACTASCPEQAITMRLFSDAKIMRKVVASLRGDLT